MKQQIFGLCDSRSLHDETKEKENTDPLLDNISQEFKFKDEIGLPLGSNKLTDIVNNLLSEKKEKEKLKQLLKT